MAFEASQLLSSLSKYEILIQNIQWLLRYKGLIISVRGWYESGADIYIYIYKVLDFDNQHDLIYSLKFFDICSSKSNIACSSSSSVLSPLISTSAVE